MTRESRYYLGPTTNPDMLKKVVMQVVRRVLTGITPKSILLLRARIILAIESVENSLHNEN